MRDDEMETPTVETVGRGNEEDEEETVPDTEPREEQEGGGDDDSLPSMSSLGQVAFRWEDCVDLTAENCCRVIGARQSSLQVQGEDPHCCWKRFLCNLWDTSNEHQQFFNHHCFARQEDWSNWCVPKGSQHTARAHGHGQLY